MCEFNEEYTTLTVPIGFPEQDYQVVNLLMALDSLCCTFMQTRDITSGEMKDALLMYAKHLKDDE